MVQISVEDVQRLRASVERHEQRRRPDETVAIQYLGGPLDGLTGRTTAYAATCRYIGWCVVTITGPVQALYEPAGTTGQWRFCALEAQR